MIVVSNTSPLINLAVIGKLDLLHQLYGRIVILEHGLRELKVDCFLDRYARGGISFGAETPVKEVG